MYDKIDFLLSRFMMAKATNNTSIRISANLHKILKKAAENTNRSVSGQVEYWCSIGIVAEKEIPFNKIQDLIYPFLKGIIKNLYSVKLSAEFYEIAKSAAMTNHRSIAGQVEYWCNLGRALEENMSHTEIQNLLLHKQN